MNRIIYFRVDSQSPSGVPYSIHCFAAPGGIILPGGIFQQEDILIAMPEPVKQPDNPINLSGISDIALELSKGRTPHVKNAIISDTRAFPHTYSKVERLVNTTLFRGADKSEIGIEEILAGLE